MTKSDYKKLLNDTISQLEEIRKINQIPLIDNIYYQLVDLKLNVVELERLTKWDEINERYSFAGIAAKNMDDDDELRKNLRNIFYGSFHYSEYSEI